jgi:hypothetical protein
MDVGGAAITCNSRSAKLPEQTFHAVVGDTTSPSGTLANDEPATAASHAI